MTSVLQPPRPLLYPTQSPSGGGILLNPSRTQSSYPSRSNQSSSSSASSEEDVNTPPSSVHVTLPGSLINSLSLPYTSDEDHVLRARNGSASEYGASGSRRIRFAPLPDPRRSVLVTEHGEELPLPSVFDDDIPAPNLRNFHASPSSSLLLGDGVVVPKEVPSVVTSGPSLPRVQTVRSSVPSSPSTGVTESPTHSTAIVTPTAFCSSASSTRIAKRLLHPFRQKTDDSRRPGSRDSSSSRDDTSTSWGIPLGHWASADEGSRSAYMTGEPLSRARSAAPAAQSQPKRMLNGRVYGARKQHNKNTDFFQTIPDGEPEFVEWGYGGMGSVRSGGMWAKVQSDRKFFDGHDQERGRPGVPQASGGNEEDDDGSGMGWVKKRREERERKKREEQAAREAAGKTNAEPTSNLVSAPVSAPTTRHTPTLASADRDISTVTPAQPGPEDDSDDSDEGDAEVDDESSGSEQDDDDASQEQNFKQVLGAGVERVSRHRD